MRGKRNSLWSYFQTDSITKGSERCEHFVEFCVFSKSVSRMGEIKFFFQVKLCGQGSWLFLQWQPMGHSIWLMCIWWVLDVSKALFCLRKVNTEIVPVLRKLTEWWRKQDHKWESSTVQTQPWVGLLRTGPHGARMKGFCSSLRGSGKSLWENNVWSETWRRREVT